MNFLLALVAGIVLALVRPEELPTDPGPLFLLLNLVNFILINLFLAVFNLLPIPPFDGGHVVEGLLPRRLARQYAKLGRFGFLLLVFLLLILPMLVPGADVVERVVRPPVEWLLRLFLGG
jgi:Zn-dependent protease